MDYLEIENVHIIVKGETWLKEINLSVEKGEYVALLGHTRSGKTSLLNLVAGLLKPQKGCISLSGVDVTDMPAEDREVGFVFERFNLFPHMQVIENVTYGPRVKATDLEAAHLEAHDILSMVHLEGRDDALPRELSGGMQQRVALARAVVAGAKILLMDEPFRALDAKIRAEMRYEIRRIVKGIGLTCLHATHEIEEAMMTADKLVILNHGRIEQVGTPREIFDNPATPFTATFVAEANVWRATVEGKQLKVSDHVILDVKTELQGEVIAVLRQSDIQVTPIELTRSPSWKPSDYSNSFRGTITNVRLLGEFIRFTICLGEEMDNFTFDTRSMLSLDWQNPRSLVGKGVLVEFPGSALKLFPAGTD